MPGWDENPNLNAAEIIAFGYQFSGDRTQSIGQFSVDSSTDKVQNFFVESESTNISFRFEPDQFPQ